MMDNRKMRGKRKDMMCPQKEQREKTQEKVKKGRRCWQCSALALLMLRRRFVAVLV
jgi:hypothetical protein